MMLKRLVIFILPLFLVQCSSCQKKSTYYTDKEKQILEKTTEAIGYDYGFDTEVEIDYIFPNTFDGDAIKKKEKKFYAAIKGYDNKSLISFYEKIYKLKSITLYKMEEYKMDEEWKEYTYIKKYLLPPLDTYFGLLEKYVLIRNKGYKKNIESRKKIIDDQVQMGMD